MSPELLSDKIEVSTGIDSFSLGATISVLFNAI